MSNFNNDTLAGVTTILSMILIMLGYLVKLFWSRERDKLIDEQRTLWAVRVTTAENTAKAIEESRNNVSTAHYAQLEALKQQLKTTESEIDRLNKLLPENINKFLLEQKLLYETQVNILKQKLANMESALKEKQKEIDELTGELTKRIHLGKELTSLRDEVSFLLKQIEELENKKRTLSSCIKLIDDGPFRMEFVENRQKAMRGQRALYQEEYRRLQERTKQLEIDFRKTTEAHTQTQVKRSS